MGTLVRIIAFVMVAVLGLGPASAQHFTTASTGTTGCNTYTGMTCDSSGWTIFTPHGAWCEGNYAAPTLPTPEPACIPATTDTQIMYISQSTGVDQSGCGTWAQPCQSPIFAGIHYGRGTTSAGVGSPDWFLFKCGDTWSYSNLSGQNAAIDFNYAFSGNGGAYGNPTTGPLLISSYDGSLPHVGGVPPVPDPASCSARPRIATDHNSVGGIASNGYTAIVGIEVSSTGRDPSNLSTTVPFFNYLDSQSGGGAISVQGGFTIGNILLEDNKVTFGGSGFSNSLQSFPVSTWPTKTMLRRNIIANAYPTNAETSGVLFGVVQGTNPANILFYQNVIDASGYLNSVLYPNLGITWGANTFFNPHNIYIAGQCGNADSSCTNSPSTLDGNVFANDATASAFRTSGIYINNLFALNARSISTQFLTPGLTSTINKNVILDQLAQYPTLTGGMVIGADYPGEPVNISGANITTNIVANSPHEPTTGGILFANAAATNSAANGNTVTGNYLYNISGGTASGPNGALGPPQPGGVVAGTVTPGSGYTPSVGTIVSASQSTETYGPIPPSGTPIPASQNYVLLSLSTMLGAPSESFVYSQAGNLGSFAGAPFPSGTAVNGAYMANTCPNNSLDCSISNAIVLFGSVYSSGANYTSPINTVYYPYRQVVLTCHVSPPGCANGSGGSTGAQGFTADVIADGNGHIVVVNMISSDGICGSANCQPPPSCSAAPLPTNGGCESPNDPGKNYSIGDVLDIPALPPGGGGTGSGATFTVTAITSNSIVPVNNFIDAAGLNNILTGQPWPDPNRTLGWYYATHTVSPTANATFTGVISASGKVLTVSGWSGNPINVGDAVYWTSPTQGAADFIKSTAGGNISTLGSLTASACSVSPAGCQGVGGIASLGSVTATGPCQPGGCAVGVYPNVPLTGLHGVGAVGTITVTNSSTPTVTGAVITSPGEGYSTSDALAVDSNRIGGGNGYALNFTVSPSAIVPPLAGPFTFVGNVAGSSSATFTGTGAGTSLTASSVAGTIAQGDVITGTGVPANTYIVSGPGGGGAGTYVTSNSTTATGTISAFTTSGIGVIGGHCGNNVEGNSIPAVDLTVASGIVTNVTLIPGSGWGCLAGDTFSVPAGCIGGQSYCVGVSGGSQLVDSGFSNISFPVATFAAPTTPPLSTACNGSPCTGNGGNGTYALTGANSGACGGGGCTMSTYNSNQLIQLMHGLSKHNWDNNPKCSPTNNHCLTALVVNSVIAQGFGLSW